MIIDWCVSPPVDGLRGYHGWRWIFIIEGAITVLVCLVFLFTFPAFPEQAKWLTEPEREYVKARLRADLGHNAAERKVTLRDVLTVLRDPKVIVGGFMYFGLIVPAYGYAYFAPSIIQAYGYSPIETQLHSVPPWAVAFGFSSEYRSFPAAFPRSLSSRLFQSVSLRDP